MPKSTKRRYTRKNSGKMSRRYRKKTMRGGDVPAVEDETKKNKDDVMNASKDEIFKSDKISTQPCNDPEYKEIGIIHMSDSIAINLLRDATSDLFNVFGAKGFDNSIYDQLRNTCFQKLQDSITANQKICNVRIDIERDKSLIYMHVYGTLLENKNTDMSEEPLLEENKEEPEEENKEESLLEENKEEPEEENKEESLLEENKEEPLLEENKEESLLEENKEEPEEENKEESLLEENKEESKEENKEESKEENK